MTFTTEWDTAPNPVYDIWTSVNGSEVVPGVLSPLSASSFNRTDYDGLLELMATYPSGEYVQHFPPPVGNFFGIFGGRLALNNGYSVAAVSALDGEIAQAILQQFFTGATGGERFLVDVPEDVRKAAYEVASQQRADAPAKLSADHARLMAERRTDQFERDLALDLPTALARYIDIFEDNAKDLLNTHYMVSVAAGEFQVRLGGVLQAGGADPNLVVPLCSGLGEVESSKPAIELFELTRRVAKHATVAAALRAGDLEAFQTALADPPDDAWRDFADAFGEFLVLFGYRGQGEADPANADWREDPTFALSQIRSMLALDESDSPAAAAARAHDDREALEAQVRASLPEELRDAFDDVRARAQDFTRLREKSKAVWVLGARRARAPHLAVCRGLVEAGVVANEADAKLLTLSEVEQAVAGKPIDELAGHIERRRAQMVEAENWRLPDNWVGETELERRGTAHGDGTLTGLGVCIGSGPVTGTARIIPSAVAGLARDIEPGDILVAPFTDAPWTPLFVTAGAVVVETGGVLSHAATVAREFNIPAVVMVKDATTLIADGDSVTVDGAAGTVTIN